MSQYEAGIIPHSAHTLDVVEDAVGEAGLVLAPGPGDGEKCLPSSSSRGRQGAGAPVPGAKRRRRRWGKAREQGRRGHWSLVSREEARRRGLPSPALALSGGFGVRDRGRPLPERGG